MWTWQRATDLPEDDLFSLAEELTIILRSEAKVEELEELSDHTPSGFNPGTTQYQPPQTIQWHPAPQEPRREVPQYVSARLPESPERPQVEADENVQEFRQQEKERYTKSPTLPYEFFDRRVSNRIVVGPALRPGPGGDRKMRDHPMLISERPSHVNLKNLVIDAVARLDGQAGSKVQVCGKIKESQYLVTTLTEQQIQNWVGGALERMQAEKWDPAVTFDMDRKLWVYLHADRTVENWREKARDLQMAKRQATEVDTNAQPNSNGTTVADGDVGGPPQPKSIKMDPSITVAEASPQQPQPQIQPTAVARMVLEPGPASVNLQPGVSLQPGPPQPRG